MYPELQSVVGFAQDKFLDISITLIYFLQFEGEGENPYSPAVINTTVRIES